MEVIFREIGIREQNFIVDAMKRGESFIFIVGNSTKELNSFMKFMNRLKKSNVEMNIRMSIQR